MDAPVVPFDFVRMFLGDEAPLFLLEILFRTLVIYFYTLGLLRWIGGRTVAQLSMVEFLLVIALGSAVGDALFYPDVPLVHAILAITVVVLINKGLDMLILRSQRAKRMVDGTPTQAVTEGRILLATLRRDAVGPDEFLSKLRVEGVRNLGEIERAYVEPDGRISVFLRADPRPGLRIVPPHEVIQPVALTEPALAVGGLACCVLCGGLSPADEVVPDGACPYCEERHWTAPSMGTAGL